MNKADLEEKQERRMRYGFLSLFLLVLGGIHFMDPAFYPTVYQLSKSGDLGGTITYLRGFGVYAVFVSFFIDVVINIVGFLPSIFISTANGLIFGLFWGTMISWLAETLGVMISFWVMRVLFRSLAKRVIEQSKTLTALDSYDSWQAVAAARAIPYMPNGLVTAICALSGMSFRSHMAGSLLGKLPSVALEVVVGHDVVHLGEHSLRLTIIIIVVSAVYGAVWWYMKKRKNRERDT